MTQDLLDIDIRLLLLRYGRPAVLQALARQGDQTVEALEQQLQTLADRKASKAKRAKPSLLDLVAAQASDRPDIAEHLRRLALGFEHRTFLPQLRDVQRFLDRAGTAHGKLKSRAVAAPLIIKTLARLSADELARLTAAEATGKESDYTVLARAIMGTTTAKPSDPTENK